MSPEALTEICLIGTSPILVPPPHPLVTSSRLLHRRWLYYKMKGLFETLKRALHISSTLCNSSTSQYDDGRLIKRTLVSRKEISRNVLKKELLLIPDSHSISIGALCIMAYGIRSERYNMYKSKKIWLYEVGKPGEDCKSFSRLYVSCEPYIIGAKKTCSEQIAESPIRRTVGESNIQEARLVPSTHIPQFYSFYLYIIFLSFTAPITS